MKIYLARHGEYKNPDNVVPYRLPGFTLTDLGKEHAQRQADKLVGQKIRDIFTSPIERCVETATIIGKILHLHPNQTEEITETGTPLQGLTKAELEKLSPNYPYDVPSHIDGSGETPEDIFTRMNKLITRLEGMSNNSAHLIVSHADPIHIYVTGILTKHIPYADADFFHSKIRYIPMGGLVLLEYGKNKIPTYTEII